MQFKLRTGSAGFILSRSKLAEIVSKNKNSFSINDQSPDWIEIHNPSEAVINLTGYFLSDEEQNPGGNLYEVTINGL